MSPEDKAWYNLQMEMFESAGWRDMKESIEQLLSNTENDILAGTKDTFDYLSGQRQTLKWFAGYEDTIKANYANSMEEDSASI